MKARTRRQTENLRLIRTAMSAALLSFAVTSSNADALNGQRLAQRWCAPCHSLPGNSGPAPALAAIARNGEFTREKLAISILLFHPNMSNVTMTRDEASDLADYVATLGRLK
jgi:mono/diheme cytochrome c family protein